VRVLQLPAAGLDGLAASVRSATLPLLPDPTDAEPPFNGHLTLARSKGRRLGVAALGEMSGLPFEAAFEVSGMDLVASQPSPQGHVYRTLVRAPLGNG
jgi:2'-5' RNA ligase